MSERAAMKRRVRGLLHNGWWAPLLALVLSALPMLVVSALAIPLLRPDAVGGLFGDVEFVFSLSDPTAMVLPLLPLFLEPWTLLEPLLGWAPLLTVLLVMTVFVALPICVSTSGYFLALLRGKSPKVTDVYSCFSGRYPRILGGTAYMLLWCVSWFLTAFILPTALLFGSVQLVSALGIELFTQLFIFLGIAVLCVVWYIVFFFLFINRMLAYCLTPICIAAQPRLPSHRAVRLSRKLMRGCKWRVIGMCLSFLTYFLPAIIAALLLPVLARFGLQMGLTEIMQRSLRTFLYVVIGANQAVWVYVWPYLVATLHAFYIERKREALMDQEVVPDDFTAKMPRVEAGAGEQRPPRRARRS